MTRPIGYYVHHHGDGHRQRALAIARAMPGRITLIGTGLDGRTGEVPCLDLPDDRLSSGSAFDGSDGAWDRPAALHYAPIDHDGVRARTASLASWLAREKPALLVVDVSAEIAMLARLAATRTVYVRLAGRREDEPHLDAFRGAAALIAPFHRDLDDPATAAWICDKTLYLPGLTSARSATGRPLPATVLVVHGRGGPDGDGEALAAAARATPSLCWRVLGPASTPRERPSNLSLAGWVDDAESEIARATIVVGAAGDGLVNAVLASERPFICLPQPRPFDEQHFKAKRLHALRAAISLEAWPEPGHWPGLIEAARRLDPAAQRRLHDPEGAACAARCLIRIAENGTIDDVA